MADTASETGDLIALMARYGIATFEYSSGERAIRIVNGVIEDADMQAGLPSNPVSSASVGLIRSPAVGRFSQSSQAALPLAVAKGDIVGFVSSGLLRLPVTVPDDGELLSACHTDETAVGYGTALFEFCKHA